MSNVNTALSDLFFNHQNEISQCAIKISGFDYYCENVYNALVEDAESLIHLVEVATGVELQVTPKDLALDYISRV